MTGWKPHHRLAALAVSFAALLPLSSSLCVAADRVALIIGNGKYTAGPDLVRPANDADDLAKAFGDIGFDVTELTDVDGHTMRSAFRDFDKKATGASVAVIYFAGHGIAVDGVNYLLPVDARLERDSYVDDEAVPLSRLVASVDRAADLHLVFLDSARANPFVATMKRSPGKRIVQQGLVAVDPDAATVVALAARNGTVVDAGTSRNSPFALALLARLKTPGLDLDAFLRQMRADVANATGGRLQSVVFGPTTAAVPVVPDAETIAMLRRKGPPPAAQLSESELAEAFHNAERLSTVEGWDAFLQFCTAANITNTYCVAAVSTRRKLIDSGRGSRRAELSGDGSGSGVLGMFTELSKVIPGEDAADTCDRLAAHTYDADKPAAVEGTALEGLSTVADRAIDACTEAAKANPGERRFAFELGRAFHAAGRFEEAMTWYGKAADAGSAIALSNIGVLHASGAGVAVDYRAAEDWYKKAAEAGNLAGMANLAALHQNGDGVTQDLGEARNWYARAAAGGNAAAMNALALLYQDGAGGPQDLDAARELFAQAADKGYPDAINNLARLYNYGRGVAVDYDRARALYEKAAALNNSSAMVNLGVMDENGQGKRRDFRAARSWYEKAAALNDRAAMTNLGILYQYGRGVDEDAGAAQKWYEAAAALGEAAAMANLGYMYDGGRGVPLDKVKAREWYLKGAEAGNAPAMASIGYLYANGQGGPADYAAAIRWYQRGADLGNAGAMTNMGFMYESGWGVKQSYKRALDWYKRGAEAGNPIGMANIGLMYEQGRGVNKDLDQAFAWYKQAAEAGNAQGMASLAYFYTNGLGTAADPAAALEWYTRAANLGDTTAMHNLGVAYEDGIGTEPNLRRAADLFLQAMQAGSTWTFDQFRDQPENYPVEVRQAIERYLITNGYMTGEADGEIDDTTRAALTALQQSLGGRGG